MPSSSPAEAEAPSAPDALATGGIIYRVEGVGRDEVLRSMVASLRLPDGSDPDFVYEVLRARENLGSTAVGDGVAIPHPRHPLVLHVTRPSITLGFLETPVEFGALDGKPVDTLFVILTPTVRAHLHLLALLAFGMHQSGFRRAVRQRAGRAEILREAAHVDSLRPAAEQAASARGGR